MSEMTTVRRLEVPLSRRAAYRFVQLFGLDALQHAIDARSTRFAVLGWKVTYDHCGADDFCAWTLAHF